jgi:hypothetical protein
MSFTRTAISIAVLLGAPMLAVAQPYYGYQQQQYQQPSYQPSPSNYYNPLTYGMGQAVPTPTAPPQYAPVKPFCGWRPCEGY